MHPIRLAMEMKRKVLMRVLKGTLYETYTAWATYVKETLEERYSCLTRVTARMMHKSLALTFDMWVDATRQSIIEKAEREHRLVQLAALWMSPLLASTFQAWIDLVSDNREIKAKAAYSIGPGRLLHMCLRTWAHNVREQVRQREREWVSSLMEDTLPRMITEALQCASLHTPRPHPPHLLFFSSFRRILQ